MIIKCEQCQTKFRLDDSKVTDKSVKVRCAKCKHVFTVDPEEPKTARPDFNTFLDPATATATSEAAAPLPETVATSPSSSFNASFSEEPVGEVPQKEATPFDTAPEPDPFSAHDDYAFSIPEERPPLDRDAGEQELTPPPAVTGFGEFDFDDNEENVGKAVGFGPTETDERERIIPDEPLLMDEAAKPVVPHEFDFADDAMFGTVLPPVTEEAGGEAITFDFGSDNFADSVDEGNAITKQDDASLPSPDTKSDSSHDLGEIDFGDELSTVAIQQVDPDELTPSPEILFAPAEETTKEETLQEVLAKQEDLEKSSLNASAVIQEEPPPLPITSRRKQSPLFTGLLTVGACIVLAVLGYLGFTTLSPEKEKIHEETGKISVRGVKASFVTNSTSGELLLISGEALNEYSKPRAALQVKGLVYDSTGQVLASKSAFGGNPLTVEQLKSLPLDKIESAMANQFGDSLSNLEVAPGKAVPFSIVIFKLPAGAKDFGVEAAGSTVATTKQP